jgi:glyoxylase-like metal-dependent hydrolase (beta-lactamase superfamily II)
MAQWELGDITVYRVLEYEGPIVPPSFLYPTSTEAAVESHRHWLEPRLLDPDTGFIISAFHTFVIRTPRYTILVDTCGGNNKHRPQKPRYHMKNWPYIENLSSVGVKPEDVDLVIFTHLHVDHVGWNTKLSNGQWVPTFPNAKYLFPRIEWEFWEEHYKTPEFTDDPYYLDSIIPVIEAGQVELIESDHIFEDEVWLEPVTGHTPGHVLLHISSGIQEAVMCGDVMHHPLQCAEPDWNSCFCVEPETSRLARYAFLKRYADTDT